MSAGQLIQLYKEVANTIDSLKKKKGTITSLALDKHKKQKSATFALTSETLKCTKNFFNSSRRNHN
jgi:hypothetical protein